MSSNDAGNLAAAQNGVTMEGIIKTLYPGAEFSYLGLVDLLIDGVPVEIKSCQDRIRDTSNAGGSRTGRFCFKDVQHQALIENGGEYIFLVHKQGVPFLYFRVPAYCVDLPAFTGVKSVCWKTLITGAIC